MMNNHSFDIGKQTEAFLNVVDKQLAPQKQLLENGINSFIKSISSMQEKHSITVLDRYRQLVKEQLGDDSNDAIYYAIAKNIVAYHLEENGEVFDDDLYQNDRKYKSQIKSIIDQKKIWIGTEETSVLGNFLIRNERPAALRLRKHVFAIAFVLDLSINQLQRYMMHTLGQSDFNFRDPYEVMIVFSLICGGVKYETYRKLCDMYEKEISRLSADGAVHVDENANTTYYQKRLQRIIADIRNPEDIEEKLIPFLCKLPRTNRKSSGRVMKDICRRIHNVEKIFMSYEAFQLLENQDVFVQNIQIEKKGAFKEIKQRAGFPENKNFLDTKAREKLLRDFDFSATVFSKENILTMLFYEYVCSGTRDIVWARNYTHPELLKKVYNGFASFSMEDLNRAGYDNFYIVNEYERFLLYCLLTRDPIQTFSEVVSK